MKKKEKSKPRPHGRRPGLASGGTKKGARVSGRVWIAKGKDTVLSWGRVVLLERIKQHGSISAAARSMGMGYRHAWELVDEMNRTCPKPLVQKKIGGPGGGGAELTPAGERVIFRWWKLVEEFSDWLSDREPRLWQEEKE
jgi:molybdate transport system regulatory protein